VPTFTEYIFRVQIAADSPATQLPFSPYLSLTLQGELPQFRLAKLGKDQKISMIQSILRFHLKSSQMQIQFMLLTLHSRKLIQWHGVFLPT